MALQRPLHPMPDDVERELTERGLMEAYRERPAYQRNDWMGWLERAARPETRRKRIDSMLSDLAAGEGYMGMAWRPRDGGPKR